MLISEESHSWYEESDVETVKDMSTYHNLIATTIIPEEDHLFQH